MLCSGHCTRIFLYLPSVIALLFLSWAYLDLKHALSLLCVSYKHIYVYIHM